MPKKLSKKQELYNWLKEQPGDVSSLQIEQWAYRRHNILPSTARRRTRDLVTEEKIERIVKPGKALIYYRVPSQLGLL